MPNEMDRKVHPLKAGGEPADGSRENTEWIEAATAPKRPRPVIAGALCARLVCAALVLAAVFFLMRWYYRSTPLEFQNVPQIMAQKLETLSAIRIHFLKSIEAEKLAVMAETDEASQAFADESRRAAERVDAELQELSGLIGREPAAGELKLFKEFEIAWAQVRKIDQVILDLAAQNTNLKAFRLSFGQGREALERFEGALNALTRDVTDVQRIRAASDALSGELEIYTWHAPHISTPDDAEMTRIEQTIHAKEQVVRHSLESLERLAPAGRQADVNEAVAAHREFMAVTETVIAWSRENTNVTSLNISLDRKQKAAALCEDVLKRLHEAFKQQAFKATR
jgi:hypothetical protein